MTRRILPDQLAGVVQPHDVVFVPGGVSVPLAFIDDLMRNPEHSRDVHIVTSIAPGIANPIDIERLDPSAVVTGLFMQPSLSQAQRSGRFRALPLGYSGFVRHVRERVDIDLTVLQVTPPDASGRCSLGPSVEFLPVALGKTRRVMALINPALPRTRGALTVPYSLFDFVCEIEATIPEYRTDSDDATRAIAGHMAELVTDGCTLQTGLGKVPAALASRLRSHRKLRLHSGMLSDGLKELAEAGALDEDFVHTACVVAGSGQFYEWSTGFDGLRVVGCEVTHCTSELAGLERFTSVNSALEVDLFGQCNLEHANGRAVSGAGGAPDFARAASQSPGGRSIVALNSATSRGTASRIVPRLGEQAVASLSRIDVDHVVTEFGIADLRGASVHERAHALIAIAAPHFRNELQHTWDAIAARL